MDEVKNSPSPRIAVVMIAGGLGGIVGMFLLMSLLGGWGGISFSKEDLNVARWGFIFGGVPGLLLGVLNRTQLNKNCPPSRLGFLLVASLSLGLVAAMLILYFLLLNANI